MELTPNDIRNFEFPTQLRGYDKEAVDNFKEQVAITQELLKQENMKISMEMESLRTQLAGLKQFEDAIKNAAIDARRNADSTMADAHRQAEEIMAKAKAEVEEITSTRFVRRDQLQAEISQLESTRRSYLTKLQTLISSHMEWVMAIAGKEGVAIAKPSNENIEITDSKIVNRESRETLVNRPSSSNLTSTEHVEEANAASRIIPATEQENNQLAESLKKVVSEDTGVDPELAAALDNYRKLAEKASVKTTPAAESGEAATAKVKQVKNEVKPDGPNLDVSLSPSTDTDDLANVLDSVANRFAEEMDRASKG